MAYNITIPCNQCSTEPGAGVLWTYENGEQISIQCPRCGGGEYVSGYTMEKTQDSPEQYIGYKTCIECGGVGCSECTNGKTVWFIANEI